MNENLEEILCNVCGSGDYKIISRRECLEMPIYVSICLKCGLIYLNPRFKKEKYGQFYNNRYDQHYRDYLEKNVEKEYKRGRAVKIFKRVLHFEKLIEFLDIGAGDGMVLEFFKSRFKGISLSAIEPSEICQRILKDKNIKLLSNDVDSDWHLNNENKLDFIILRQTLEHLHDPLSVLKKIKYALSENGLLYVSVPNMMRPPSDGLLRNIWFIMPHVYYFSKDTLLALIAKAGLKPIKIVDADCELWGIFKKGEFEFNYKNNYKRQRLALLKHHLKYFIKFILGMTKK